MAKFDPKKADLNKDGKLSDYESNVGQKRAAAMKMDHSPKKMDHAMKMNKSPMYNYKNGYAMKMGSKEINSPSAFNMKDMANIQASPMMNHISGHDPKDKNSKSTIFSVDPNKGAKLQTEVTTTTNPIQSSKSVQKKSTNNLSNYQKGLKNLGPNFKPTQAQTDAANKKVAELRKKDSDAGKFNSSIKQASNPGSSSTTKKSTKINPVTSKQINKESKQKVSKAIGDENFRRYEVEMQAKRDSTSRAEKFINSKLTSLGRDPKTDKKIYTHAGIGGNRAANKTRFKGGVKFVKGTYNKSTKDYQYSRKGGYLIK